MLKSVKAQTAIEYMLLIAAGVVFVSIIAFIVKNRVLG